MAEVVSDSKVVGAKAVASEIPVGLCNLASELRVESDYLGGRILWGM